MNSGKEKKLTSSRKKNRISGFFSDERFRLSIGSFILVFALFLTLSFISYFFTWKTDQSFEWEKIISSPDLRVENWAGKSGAWLSSLFMNKWFGIASFSIPFLLILIGFKLIRVRLASFGRTFRLVITGAILLSLVLGYIFGVAGGFLGSGPGGAHGYFMAEWLNALLGKTGTAFLLIVLVFSFFLFSVKNSSLIFHNLIHRPLKAGKDTKDGTLPVSGTLNGDISDKKSGTPEEFFELNPEVSGKSEEDYYGKDNGNKDYESSIKLLVKEKTTDEKSLPEDMIDSHKVEDYDPTLDLPHLSSLRSACLSHINRSETSVSKEELINNKIK
jgi:DNA segregation ATPase FtsK/SpoIIIE, S-DNA-T family